VQSHVGGAGFNDLLSGLANAAVRADEAKLSFDHPLTLVDADDKAITSADFPGKWLLILFDHCPTALSAMAEALDEIGPAADHVQPLFISVDSERDRGPILRDVFQPEARTRTLGRGSRQNTRQRASAPASHQSPAFASLPLRGFKTINALIPC
jgi:protein SCO1/2